jgi:hypothetical protein
MSKEEKDTIDSQLKALLYRYDEPPPERLRENIERMNVPIVHHSGLTTGWRGIQRQPEVNRFRYIVAASLVILIASLLIFYLLAEKDYDIAGQVFAGESHLCRGTAVLFEVTDVAEPRDSVRHYRSARVDERGFFRFSNIKRGNYLIRINPDHGSEASIHFKPSWYDQDESSEVSDLIRIADNDFRADIHLVRREMR